MNRVSVGKAAIAFASLAGLMLVAGFLFPRPPQVELQKTAQPVKEAGPAQMLEGVKLDGGEPGRSKWSLSAKRAEADASGEVGTLFDVALSFTAKDGMVEGEAGKAQKLSAAGSYLFSGGVRVSRDDWSVKTGSVRYDQAAGRLWGDEPVALTAGRIDLNGSAFVADVNESWVRIKGPTHAVIKGAVK